MRSCTRNRPTTASFLGSAAVGLFLPKTPAPLRLPVHVTAMNIPSAWWRSARCRKSACNILLASNHECTAKVSSTVPPHFFTEESAW
jgi:hypothetical protein